MPRPRIRTAMLALAVAAELPLVFYALQPKLSVQVGDPLQPLNILSAPVILTNAGILPIYDISVSCTGPGTIIDSDGETVFPAVSRLNGTKRIKSLGIGRTIATNDVCKSPKNEHPMQLEAVVRIAFEPLFMHMQHEAIRVSIASLLSQKFVN